MAVVVGTAASVKENDEKSSPFEKNEKEWETNSYQVCCDCSFFSIWFTEPLWCDAFRMGYFIPVLYQV